MSERRGNVNLGALAFDAYGTLFDVPTTRSLLMSN